MKIVHELYKAILVLVQDIDILLQAMSSPLIDCNSHNGISFVKQASYDSQVLNTRCSLEQCRYEIVGVFIYHESIYDIITFFIGITHDFDQV